MKDNLNHRGVKLSLSMCPLTNETTDHFSLVIE